MAAHIEADYVVIGCGAAGMAFADTLIRHSNATIAMIDRHHRPGGHWNDAYPFVQLHLPSHYYGVDSEPLGDRSLYRGGYNDGLLHMASGAEIVAYYDRVMERVLLAFGRVTYLPMSNWDGEGNVTSLLTGERRSIGARKRLVDATFAATKVPSTHTRSFLVADGVVCIPINDLPCVERPPECYCIIGSGKTGIDACLWLLANKVSPDSIRWIMPRDGWWSNRAKLQWTEDFFETSVSSVADQMEALAEATSVDDLFVRFEACGASYRLDPDITPTMFHGATISASELNALRQIKDIVRMGRVKSIQREAIILERGELASRDDCLYVDCSATGIPLRPNVPVFNDRRITLQFVRAFRPCLSAAAIAFIEAHFADDAEKNTLCAPVPPVTAGLGWVRIVSISMANHARWSNHPELMRWLASSRLDGGVHGDHWVKGCWKSTEGGKPHPDVQICIMNARCIQLIAQERPNWPPAGDNLFIDMDLSPDNTPPGTRLGIGTAVIEITAIPHNGCASFAARYGVMRRSS